MKYIIAQNKLNSIINDFISSQFDGLEHIDETDKYGFGNRRDVWVDSEGRPVIIILNRYSKQNDRDVLIVDDVYGLIYNMFSMTGFHEIQKHLVHWFEKHMDIKVAEVKTFDIGEYVY